jgi:hypothetical protein
MTALSSDFARFDKILLNVFGKEMQVDSLPVQSEPIILNTLPNPPLADELCPRRARLQLDLLLLALEALDLGGSESFLAIAKELGLQGVIKNRVSLWRLRSTNPFRRYTQRQPLTFSEAKALVLVICNLSRRLTVLVRQLLLADQQLREKGLSADRHSPRLATYLERFRAHFRARMNPKRSGVVAYSTDEKLNDLAMTLLGQLLFCTGTSGALRLWNSLFDGEVS